MPGQCDDLDVDEIAHLVLDLREAPHRAAADADPAVEVRTDRREPAGDGGGDRIQAARRQIVVRHGRVRLNDRVDRAGQVLRRIGYPVRHECLVQVRVRLGRSREQHHPGQVEGDRNRHGAIGRADSGPRFCRADVGNDAAVDDDIHQPAIGQSGGGKQHGRCRLRIHAQMLAAENRVTMYWCDDRHLVVICAFSHTKTGRLSRLI